MKKFPRHDTPEFAHMIAGEVAREAYRRIIQNGTTDRCPIALLPDQIEDFALSSAYKAYLNLKDCEYKPVFRDSGEFVYDVRSGLTYNATTGESY